MAILPDDCSITFRKFHRNQFSILAKRKKYICRRAEAAAENAKNQKHNASGEV